MAKRPRRNQSPVSTAKVALTNVRGESTLAEKFDVQANHWTAWKAQFRQEAARVLDGFAKRELTQPALDVKTLHVKLGELMLEDEFYPGVLLSLIPQAVSASGRQISHEGASITKLYVPESLTMQTKI